MALIDTVYPPLHCTACDHVSFTTEEARRHQHRQALLCLHPHCEKIFRTRTALLFHIQHSHLVVQATLATAPPLISCATSSSCSSSSLSSFSSSSSPTTATATATTLTNMISSFPSAIYAGDDDVDDNDDENDDDKDSQNRSLSSSPAPRGSKKIVLSPDIDARLNAVYHPLQCPSCLKHFKRKTNVIKHLTDDHYGEEPYRCIFPECSHPKLYATREGLVYHILRAHDACSSSQAQQQQHSSTPASFSKRKL
ncbi:hypothetical protein BX666DRAFT_2132329 [Dichotomocladium elegans]|nr:hypothetical protein BX666DRAFT_2132329 [Dichotomocladium elegans]